MVCIPFRYVLLAAIGVAAHTSVTFAQEQEEKHVTEVIQLREVDLDQAMELVQELYGHRLQAVTGAYDTDRLILRGPVTVVADAMELILKVDVAGAPAPDATTAFIPVQTYPIEHIAPLVASLYLEGAAQLGVDHVNRQLVVSGSPEGIAVIRDIVRSIDRPKQTLRLEFAFLRGEVGGASGNDAAVLPAAMMPAAKTLHDNGFGGLTLMAPLIVLVDAGKRFDASSTLAYGDQTPHEILQFHVEGEAQMHPGSEQFELELTATMEGQRTRRGTDGPQIRAWFSIETSVTTRLGVYTVLAAAPSSTEHGSAIALLIRVTSH